MQGFPGYFRLPEVDAILSHVLSLFTYWTSRYSGRSSTQSAESGSLSLCANSLLWLPSDPAASPLARIGALAIRITFPVNRAASASRIEERPRCSADRVCRPRRANRKRGRPESTSFPMERASNEVKERARLPSAWKNRPTRIAPQRGKQEQLPCSVRF